MRSDFLRNDSYHSTEVVVCSKDKIFETVPEVLFRAGFEPKEYGLVLVKPNLCGLYHPENRLIEATLRFLFPHSRRIVVGETNSMGHTPDVQFRRLGIDDMLKPFGDRVEALNLMKDEILELEVPSPHAVSRLPIPRLVRDCDLLVNIPRVGAHSRTLLTCALKNLFGLLAEGNKYDVYHPLGVDKVIADLPKIVRCDLNIADAGDKVVVGVDPLSVDIFACRFVGLDPLKVEHLRLVSQDRDVRLEDAVKKLRIVSM